VFSLVFGCSANHSIPSLTRQLGAGNSSSSRNGGSAGLLRAAPVPSLFAKKSRSACRASRLPRYAESFTSKFTITLSVGATASPGAYAFSADVVSSSTYGESSPVTLYVSIVTPNPNSTPGPQGSPTPTSSPASTSTPQGSQTPTPQPTPDPTPTPAGTANPQAIYSPIIPQLHAGTSVPILLPNNLSMVVSTLYASILSVSSTQYAVFIDARPKCFGATACEQIYVAGQSLSASPTPSPPTGTPMQLSNGITAYFTQATCGASCGYSNLSWNSGSSQYTLGIKGGSRTDLLNAANSMASY